MKYFDCMFYGQQKDVLQHNLLVALGGGQMFGIVRLIKIRIGLRVQ